MKIRDSGMPDEAYWESLFDVPLILARLDIRPRPEQIIDWARKAGLEPIGNIINLPPWHYGLRLSGKV